MSNRTVSTADAVAFCTQTDDEYSEESCGGMDTDEEEELDTVLMENEYESIDTG